jgi:hypothetical protein
MISPNTTATNVTAISKARSENRQPYQRSAADFVTMEICLEGYDVPARSVAAASIPIAKRNCLVFGRATVYVHPYTTLGDAEVKWLFDNLD